MKILYEARVPYVRFPYVSSRTLAIVVGHGNYEEPDEVGVGLG